LYEEIIPYHGAADDYCDAMCASDITVGCRAIIFSVIPGCVRVTHRSLGLSGVGSRLAADHGRGHGAKVVA